MNELSPPNWNFYGTVERLIRATETLLDRHSERRGSDQDLARNMILRLSVIMEDASIYMTQEDQDRRADLEQRLKSIRERFDFGLDGDEGHEPQRFVTGANMNRFGRVSQ